MKAKFPILCQPDDSTCGPTSLHAVYKSLGCNCELDDLINQIEKLDHGGTLGVCLGIDALKRKFKARLLSYNLKIFDPSWAKLKPVAIQKKLKEQLKYKKGKKFTTASKAYIRFLEHGGIIDLHELTPTLLKSFLNKSVPLIVGLSATYLYQCMREREVSNEKLVYDDLKGEPCGHFVVLYGINNNKVLIADPYAQNPLIKKHHYEVDIHRVMNAIMLGIITYDANLLVIEK